ncbi:sugar ABC transporter ATP-binding protein [Marmoricola endophyticus]|uniref:Sugar ABC transporter ATP-binding protein n=1 Tax=Marmoricola endophyticus TaxID=2040280 RepID=A0A917BPC2_9ACTN|nr:sugar ABC transporter ATP-binding protein [Marmoricola endophyticus]GGF51105.1 sugar ABC transporter ATP-binding protein [Marmoricola endophyticus]
MTDDVRPPVLQAQGITKVFGGVRALSGVDFALGEGEAHALVGENGAGKSTLIKVLTGVHRPDEGQVLLGGEPRSFGRPLDAQQAGISTIYQEVNLIPLMSAAQNVYLGREPRTSFGLVDTRAMERDARELLDSYGIDVDVRRPLRTLGLGAQQMVALARAVSIDARVVIMDEPTSSLEPREVRTLFEVIARLREQGIAIVYVSHRMDELYEVCEKVTVLRDGRLVHTGDLADLPRLELVAMMLGRTTSEMSGSGVTEFGEEAHTQAAEPVLVAEHLTRKHEIEDVALSVRPGEVLGLGGLLGAGRSETLKAVAGAMPLDRGQVSLDGKRVRSGSVPAAIRAGVVLLPEDRKAEGIIPNLSVRENIVLAALPRLSRFGFTSRRKQDAVVRTMMERLHIKASSPEQPVAELSGGNQQKVMIARWLAMSPRVLLLDEPTRGIDVGAKAEVQALIDELAREGLGIVLVSSELEEVIEGADRMVVLKDGAVVAELNGEEITEERLMAALSTETALPADPGAPPEEASRG